MQVLHLVRSLARTALVSIASQRTAALGRLCKVGAVALIFVSAGSAQDQPGVETSDADRLARKQQMTALGLEYETASDLYRALERRANISNRRSSIEPPDWSGLWARDLSRGIPFDPDQPRGGLPTAKLTPEFQRRLLDKIKSAAEGNEYDPISDCSPPGHPRWLTIPFLREFVVTPEQTWLMSEVVNSVRRIYTDGRSHLPEADRYPLPYGDSIGFWDGDRLIVHTNQLQAGQYTRLQPDYTEHVETVEIWQKTDGSTMEVDVWVYDPPALVEPWYVRQRYAKLSNPDKGLRIQYWHCTENQNNEITRTEEGGSDFTDFSFTDTDNRD